eukprot:TRINITY_DN6580_c0_g1_i1.p1 TRINITY_DN6580_c0_g1~~TRINITY_DN6580_c0_g1_i1.p1  ORF type:complete len:760 (+),score=148.21 TRINITY_DN6580_c0_g1_i1:61-2280(+)
MSSRHAKLAQELRQLELPKSFTNLSLDADWSLSFRYNETELSMHMEDFPDIVTLFLPHADPECFTDLKNVKDLLSKVDKVLSKQLTIVKTVDMHLSQSGECLTASFEDMAADDEKTNWETEENRLLKEAIESYQELFGDRSLSVSYSSIIEQVTVSMSIEFADILSKIACDAWGLSQDLPLVVSLEFADGMPHVTPTIYSIHQVDGESKEEIKLGWQLKNILEKFLKDKSLKNYNLNESNTSSSNLLSSVDSKKEEELPTIEQYEIEHLVEMGFSEKQAITALSMTSSLESAAALLADTEGTLPEEGGTKRILAPTTTSSKSGKFFSFGFLKGRSNKSSKRKQVSKVVSQVSKPKSGTQTSPSSPTKGLLEDEKIEYEYSTEGGYLAMIASFLRARLPFLNKHCVICDEPHLFGSNMIKPSVCTRDLCFWSFNNLGVAADVAEGIASSLDVVALLVRMASAAALSSRAQLIFDPYPTLFGSESTAVLSPEKRNPTLVTNIFNSFPAMSSIYGAPSMRAISELFMKSHELAVEMFQWILSSNRAYIVKMEEESHLKRMQTMHQYLFVSNPPELEDIFQREKKQYGSTFAFHGSPIENWHSILRRGLKNASGTSLQIHGAAYGNGIYCSPRASVSFSYSRVYSYGAYNNNNNAANNANNANDDRFLNSQQIYGIALCEVIDHNIKKSGDIWVVPSEQHICTRFFFVYTSTKIDQASNCYTLDSNFRSEIDAAMERYINNKI